MSVQRYSRRKKIIWKAIIVIFIVVSFVIWILPNLIISNIYENKDEDFAKYEKIITAKKNKTFPLKYNIMDLYNVVSLENAEYINFEEDNIIYDDKYNVNITIPQYEEDSYNIKILIDDNEIKNMNIDSDNQDIEIPVSEKENKIKVCLYKNDEIIKEKEKLIYYIQPYQSQYADKISKKGTQLHFRKNGKIDDYTKSLDLVRKLGAFCIRTGFLWSEIENAQGNMNFDYYDKCIEEASGLNICLGVSGTEGRVGAENKINNNDELDNFINFVQVAAQRYPQVKYFEILNERNLTYYTDEELEWYNKIVENSKQKLKEINSNIKLISGSTACVYNREDGWSSEEFLEKIAQKGVYNNTTGFSYHPYDWQIVNEQNYRLKNLLNTHKDVFSKMGGFVENDITEYGLSNYSANKVTEEEQSYKLIQQNVMMDNYNVDMYIQYNFRNTGNDPDNGEYNFGLVREDYTPKPSYYSMKNYYENTNGAEYIGKVNLKDNLESHIYDKDGKAKMIMWSNKANTNITMPYEDFQAKDVYGNDIQKDETGNLTVTTSPIYLDNLNRQYFYQAIKDTMKEKLEKFENKFTEEISKTNGLSEKLEQQKQIAEDIGNHNESNEITENITIQYMKDFYAIGNTLIDEYKKGTLNIEDVKLSSMLDSLNDIGYSYEDLVTITAQTRNANFEETNKKIQDTENVIKNGEDLDNIYPSKILDFAKEFNEKSTYINNLDEENDIKTGLIVSKNLHANLLADWAKQFADVYIDKYLQENPVQEITYSTEDGQEYQIENFTNKNVIATLPTTEDMQITSEGGNTHTFEQNGSFTFKYTRRGRNFEVAIKIENIDKDAPIITGVENNKLYTSQVSVNVEDKNLKEVIAIFNDKEINYTLNAPLKEEGIYVINAKDNAGNTAKKTFQLIENASEDYNVGDKYITNIQENTTAKELRKKLLSSLDYDIKRNGEKIDENEIVCTGDVIKTKDMHQNYTLIVAGDINQNGEVDIRDFVRLRRYLLRQIQLEGVEKLAADANVDNKEIGIKDFVRMKVILLSN